MEEAGLTLEKVLLIPGALGEVLDAHWDCISVLREWMAWERESTRYEEGEDYVDSLFYRPDDGEDDMDSVRVRDITPPSRVVWLHEISVLSKALSLPYGWEFHVAVDNRTPISERRNHYQASINYIRKNAISLMYEKRLARYEHNQCNLNDYPRILAEGRDERVVEEGSHLDALLHNIFLIEISKKCVSDSIGSVIQHMDWEIALEISTVEFEKIKAQEDGDTYNANRITHMHELCEYMLGKQHKCTFRLVAAKSIVGVGAPYYNASKAIYTKLLLLAQDDDNLGIEAITGATMPHIVSIDSFVGRVNSIIIHYVHKERLVAIPNARISSDVPLSRDEFPEVVQILGKTVGLYAMRRLLLSLLYYIVKNSNTKGRKENVSEKTLEKRRKAKRQLERAELFAKLLEVYLEQHQGEDEGVITLEVGKLEEAERARHYYD
jgi:hypothetical protein